MAKQDDKDLSGQTLGGRYRLVKRIGSGGMPFLIPLLLQVSLGYTPLQAGLMMVPVAAAGMAWLHVLSSASCGTRCVPPTTVLMCQRLALLMFTMGHVWHDYNGRVCEHGGHSAQASSNGYHCECFL